MLHPSVNGKEWRLRVLDGYISAYYGESWNGYISEASYEWTPSFTPVIFLMTDARALVAVEVSQVGEKGSLTRELLTQLPLKAIETNKKNLPKWVHKVGSDAAELTREELADIGNISVKPYREGPPQPVTRSDYYGTTVVSYEEPLLYESDADRISRMSRELSEQLTYWELGIRLSIQGYR